LQYEHSISSLDFFIPYFIIGHLFILKEFDIDIIFSFILLILSYTLLISISLTSLNILFVFFFIIEFSLIVFLLEFCHENKLEFLNFEFFLALSSLKSNFKPFDLCLHGHKIIFASLLDIPNLFSFCHLLYYSSSSDWGFGQIPNPQDI